MSLRVPIHKPLSHKYEAVDVRLGGGRIGENLAINSYGFIIGSIVGGHDGLDESPLPFKQENIEAHRFRAGLAGRLGPAKWHPACGDGHADKSNQQLWKHSPFLKGSAVILGRAAQPMMQRPIFNFRRGALQELPRKPSLVPLHHSNSFPHEKNR
jgi:hypothetical protein